RRRPRRWLRESSRHRSVESHVTFDFLEDLMDVTVEHSHGAESLQISQSAFTVARSPAPLRIYRPEWDVRENDNRCARSKIFHIGLKPFELVISELPQTAGLEIQDVDHSNEMDAVLIETVPARAFAFDALQIPFTVKLSAIVKHIVLPGNIENVLGSAALQYLIKGVELLGLRQLREVSCVDKERGRRRHRVDAIESNFEGRSNIFIRFLAEADV